MNAQAKVIMKLILIAIAEKAAKRTATTRVRVMIVLRALSTSTCVAYVDYLLYPEQGNGVFFGPLFF